MSAVKSIDNELSQLSQLGSSAIKKQDLEEMIQDIFLDEYSTNKIKQRVQGRNSRRTLDLTAEDLGL